MTNYQEIPRKPDLIKKEIRSLDTASLSSREWLEMHPDDRVVSLLVEQDDIRKNLLLQELKESNSYYHHHQFSFAIKTEDNVELSELSSLAVSLKNALVATLNSISSTTQSMPLFVDTIFQGSFGVLLSTEWDSELIQTKMERTFNKFFDIALSLESIGESLIDMQNEIDHDVVFSENKQLLRKFRSLYRSITVSQHSIELNWQSFNIDGKRDFYIDHEIASEIFDSLSKWDHPEPEIIEVTGSIQGVSLIDQTMQFVPFKKAGTRIKISFEDRFKDDLKQLLGEIATIVYEVKEDYNPDSDSVTSKKILLSLSSNSNND